VRGILEDSPPRSRAGLEAAVMAKSGRLKRRKLAESDDFIVDKNRITLPAANVLKRDPVNLIRVFYLAQKHNLAFHPAPMRAITRSLKLIDAKATRRQEANRLLVEILTSKKDPENRAAADE